VVGSELVFVEVVESVIAAASIPGSEEEEEEEALFDRDNWVVFFRVACTGDTVPGDRV